MPKVPNLFVPSEQLRPIQMPAAQAPGVQPYVDTQAQQIEKLGAGMERLGQGAMSFAGDMRAVERLQGQEQERKAAIAARRQDQVDDARTKEFDNRLSEILREASTNHFKLVGKAAVDAAPDVIKDVDKKFEDVINSGENETQRQQVRYLAERRKGQWREPFDKHTIEQERVYNIGETTTRINNSMLDAAGNIAGYDSQEYDVQKPGYLLFKHTMEQEVDNLATLNGLPEDSDQRKQALAKAKNDLHTMVLDQLLQKRSVVDAKAYYEYWSGKGEIEPSSAKKLLGEIKSTEVANDSLRYGIDWAAQPGTAYEKDQKLRDLVSKGKMSADIYKQVSDYLYEDEKKRDEAKAKMILSDTTWAQDQLTQPENLNKSVDQLRQIDPVRYERMKNSGSLEKVREWDRGKNRKTTDPQWQDILLQLKSAENQTEYSYVDRSSGESKPILLKPLRDMSEAEFNLVFKNHLSESDYQAGLIEWKKSKNIPETDQDIRSKEINLRTKRLLVGMGFMVASKDADGFAYNSASDADNAHRVEEKIYSMTRELGRSLGREPTMEELEKHIFRSPVLLDQVTIEDIDSTVTWFDNPDQYVSGASSARLLKAIVPANKTIDKSYHRMTEIPGYSEFIMGQPNPYPGNPSSYSNIVARLKKNNLPATTANIMDVWILDQKGSGK